MRESEKITGFLDREESREKWDRWHRVRYIMGYQMPTEVDRPAMAQTKKAEFTVNNFEVFQYNETEVYIQTDAAMPGFRQIIDANNGRLYLRLIDIARLLEFATSLNEAPRPE